MALIDITREELQQVIVQIDQALYNHQQWYNGIIRILISRESADKHDLLPDAHKECRFGQWYYDRSPKVLHNQQGFIALGEAHKRMHSLSTKLLIKSEANSPISSLDYETFTSSVDLMRLELASLRKELETLLYTRDPLTSAINRIDMLQMLREQHELVKRNAMSCVLVMIDLDHFKKVNDAYGHPAGDQVLATVIRFIIDHLRPYDKIFRYGGEEFLICLQQIDLKQSYNLIDRIRENIGKLDINLADKNIIHITISCGITILDAGIPVEQSIEHADKALYNAKSSGRNRIHSWNSID